MDIGKINGITKKRLWSKNMSEHTLRIISIVGLLLMVSAYNYYRNEFKESTLVEAKSDIDPTTLNPKNPGCTITLPDGKVLNISNMPGQSIKLPIGTSVTVECFKTKLLLKDVEPESTH